MIKNEYKQFHLTDEFLEKYKDRDLLILNKRNMFSDIFLESDKVVKLNNKYFDFSREELDAAETMLKLSKGTTIKEFFEKRYDLEDDFLYEGFKKGDVLSSGYSRLLNLFYALSCLEDDNILYIKDFDFSLNLHYFLKRLVLDDLYRFFGKKLIVSMNQMNIKNFVLPTRSTILNV